MQFCEYCCAEDDSCERNEYGFCENWKELVRMREVFRCDVCGRFIGVDDFHKGATRQLVTPLSDYSREEFETLCIEHAGGLTSP